VKEVARVYLSENGSEFLVYDGEDRLLSVKAVTSMTDVVETVGNTLTDAWRDDFVERNGRYYMACLGYQDCRPGMCDEHYPNGAGYGERV
jgi:hypothetical protein